MGIEKLSAIGTYRGWSQAVADGYVRTSEYVRVRDGNRIAVDILHPALGGQRLGGGRPTVVRGTGYRRSFQKAEHSFYDVGRQRILAQFPVGAVITPYELAPNAALLVNHGYNFVSVDFRGTGASFGQNNTLENGRDLADVIDWIADQPWSDGKIGMWGRSWEAWVQLDTAAACPKHLTCLMPCALNTGRNAIFYNGVYIEGFAKGWSAMRANQDTAEIAMAVDGPGGEQLRDEARAQAAAHYAHNDIGEGTAFRLSEFIDVEQQSQAAIYPHLIGSSAGELKSPWQKIAAINACGAAVYICGGWWDMTFVNDQISFYENFAVPKKLLIGPWTHSQFEFGHETLRWFDYWLKGIDNGIMDEAPIHYGTANVHGETQWRQAQSWAEIDLPSSDFYGHLDQSLAEATPKAGEVVHTPDPLVSSGRSTRTQYMFHTERLCYGDLDDCAGRSLTFTTDPFADDFDITGLPTVQLTVTSQQDALSLFATLSAIDVDGLSYYLTEGFLNLKHRQSVMPPWRHIERHWHSEKETDALPIVPGEPMTVAIDMFALSCRLAKGTRLRLAIAAADVENYEAAAFGSQEQLNFRISADSGVRLSLPVGLAYPVNAGIANAFLDDRSDFAFQRS